MSGYRFGFAEDTVRLAAALRPALAARGVPGQVYVDNGIAVRRLLAAAGLRQARHPADPLHPRTARRAAARSNGGFRAVREQFLVEVADTTTEQLAERGLSPAAALLELNALFTAWVESVYHHRVHSETGQTPLARWDDGWQAAGHGPAMASAQALTEAFLWSEWRTVTKTATVSLHGNTYQVDPCWSAARSSWCSPRSTSTTSRCATAALLRAGGAAP